MILQSLNSTRNFQHKWWASNLRHVQNADIPPVDCYFLIILTSPLATPDFSQEIMRCDAGDCDLSAHDYLPAFLLRLSICSPPCPLDRASLGYLPWRISSARSATNVSNSTEKPLSQCGAF